MTCRIADHPIEPLFLERRSPRAFDGSELCESHLLSLIEAARWAPSAYNYQPWRFLYARRGDESWQDFLDLLVPFNAEWAQSASALVFVLSDTLLQRDAQGKASPLRTHSLDTGAAWAQLALQAVRLGLHARGMAGVDFERAREVLRVPERFHIEMAIAIGREADPEALPEHLHKKAEESLRKPLADIAFSGHFPDAG